MASMIRLTEKSAIDGEPRVVIVNLDLVAYIHRSVYRKGADVVMNSGRVIEVAEDIDEIEELLEEAEEWLGL